MTKTLLLVGTLCLSILAQAQTPLKARFQTKLSFPDGKTIVVDVVNTPEDRELGLMYRKKLPRDYGMLFVFPNQSRMQFWMKNTWVPLDMVFMDFDKHITRVHLRVKASTAKTTDEQVARAAGDAQFVLELPAGAAERHGLKIGQEIKFEAEIPER